MNTKFNILITEGSIHSNRLFAKMLEDELEKIQINFTTEANEIVKTGLSGNLPDLIILDQCLTQSSGLVVLKEIKAQSSLSDIPVIVLTSNSTLQDQMELLEFGAEDYIERNSSPGIFLARIRTQIRHKMTLTRLKQLAKDRDLFAAGVLHDINEIESTLVNLCQTIRGQVIESPEKNRESINQKLDTLREHSKKLGQYANEVIHSVRESGKPAILIPYNFGDILNWIQEFQRDHQDDFGQITWKCIDTQQLLLIDRKFCQLAVLSLIQFCQKLLPQDITLSLELSQKVQKDTSQKSTVQNLIQTNLTLPANFDLGSLFQISDYGVSVKELEMPMVARLLQNMGSKITANCYDGKLAFIIDIPKASD